RRVGNTRFFWNDGVGGLARISHDELPLTVSANPNRVEVFSRVEGLEVNVDHKPGAPVEAQVADAVGAAVAPKKHEDDEDIYAQVPGEEAMEGVNSKEDLTDAAQRVVEHIDMNHLRDRLEGRDGGLRPSKPGAEADTGFEQFVWRQARFFSGDDPKIPVTASWWLQDWLDDQNIDASVSGVLDKEGKQIMAILSVVAKILVRSFGRNPQSGLERWQKALFG
ncbi:hypothetical protein, partial [Natronomonas sp.]|uniref:hypothetical protein n=1 Tax=Natronomonas sp. TaxID=2184060 RepID=UPI002FC312BC